MANAVIPVNAVGVAIGNHQTAPQERRATDATKDLVLLSVHPADMPKLRAKPYLEGGDYTTGAKRGVVGFAASPVVIAASAEAEQ